MWRPYHARPARGVRAYLPPAVAAQVMITPAFSVDQDAASVRVTVRAPYIRAKAIEVAVGERELRLHAKPYFLSLTFEQPLVGDGDGEEGAAAAASYDVDKGNLTIEVKKVRATALA